MNKKVLLSSLMSIAMLASITTGATYALFTAEDSANIAVTSARLSVKAEVLSQFKYASLNKDLKEATGSAVFDTKGTVAVDEEGNILLDRIVPGDKVEFTIRILNDSNVTIKYQTLLESVGEENDLLEALKLTVNGVETKKFSSDWEFLNIGETNIYVPVTIELPADTNDTYQGKSAKLAFRVNAIQGNAEVENPNADEKTTYLYTEEDLRNFASDVNNGVNNYNGKTVKLMGNIDLGGESDPWTPIGLNADNANKFYGTFDGNNKTISNMYIDLGDGYTAAGFFGALDGKLENLNFEDAIVNHISTGDATDNGIAVAAGSIYSSGSIDNVHVNNAKVTGNRYLGGISGYTYGSVTNSSVSNVELVATPNEVSEDKYDNGDKVGGIAAYFECESTYTISNNSATNVTIKGYRDLGGIVGAGRGMENITNNTASNINITIDQVTNFYEVKEYNADYIVGRKLDNKEVDASNTVSGDNVIYAAIDTNEDAALASMNNAFASGENVTVVLNDDVTGSANSNSGYGAAGLTIGAGQTLDGNGNTLTVNDANGTWDCGVHTKGGTIKNLTVNGAFRGIFTGGCSSDIIIDSVTIDKVCYTFQADGANENYGVYVSNSTLNGWTSYANGFKEVLFDNCQFGEGTGGYKYAYCRPYNATTFTNCKFAEGYEFDARKTTSTFINCYVGETLITADNVVELLGEDAANIVFN